MPKLYSARTIIKALERNGFILIGQKGSHVKLRRKLGEHKLTVIVPCHKEVAIGTFLSILKQAGITRKEFEKLLR